MHFDQVTANGVNSNSNLNDKNSYLHNRHES